MTLADIVFGVIFATVVLLVFFMVKGKGAAFQDFFYPYPISSKPGDKMLPAKGDTMGWIAYILMCVGILPFLAYIGSLIIGRELPFIIPMAGLTVFYLGVAIQSIKTKFKKNEN